MKRTTVFLDQQTEDWLNSQCKKENRNRSQHIRELVKAEQKRLKRNKDK